MGGFQIQIHLIEAATNALYNLIGAGKPSLRTDIPFSLWCATSERLSLMIQNTETPLINYYKLPIPEAQ